jgi:hypothetical protein
LFNIGIFLFLGGVVNAETDLLNLSAYSEGDELPYGEKITVGVVEKTGEKYITATPSSSGTMKFPVNLAGDFEVAFTVYEYYCCTEDFNLFLTSDEHQIKVSFSGAGGVALSADSERGSDQSKAFKQELRNSYRLSVSNNVAKLYVNDVFSQKVTLTPDLTYTLLLIAGVERADAMYELRMNGGTTGATPPSNGGDFDSGKQAGIQQCVSDPASCGITVTATCDGTTPTTSGTHASYNPANGEVHIPFIDVPGPFGDQQVYEVFLIQQPSTFSFDLDLNRLNLRQ